jgi:hypothetical protein
MSDGYKSDQKQSLAERVITATALWTSRLLGIANASAWKPMLQARS